VKSNRLSHRVIIENASVVNAIFAMNPAGAAAISAKLLTGDGNSTTR
jgi:hypothetical protein